MTIHLSITIPEITKFILKAVLLFLGVFLCIGLYIYIFQQGENNQWALTLYEAQTPNPFWIDYTTIILAPLLLLFLVLSVGIGIVIGNRDSAQKKVNYKKARMVAIISGMVLFLALAFMCLGQHFCRNLSSSFERWLTLVVFPNRPEHLHFSISFAADMSLYTSLTTCAAYQFVKALCTINLRRKPSAKTVQANEPTPAVHTN